MTLYQLIIDYLLSLQGIYSNVTLNDTLLLDWSMYPLTIDKIIPEIKKSLHRSAIRVRPAVNSPSFYYSEVILDPNNDTFLDPMGWSKVSVYNLFLPKQ